MTSHRTPAVLANAHVEPVPCMRVDQQATLEFIRGRRRCLVLSEPGTGKTAPLLSAAAAVVDDGGTALMAVPSTLIDQVRQEVALWAPHLTPVINEAPTLAWPFSIVSHHSLSKVLRSVQPKGLGLLVVDEAHVLATAHPKPTGLHEAAYSAGLLAARSVFATGTPVDCVAALDLMGLLRAARLIPPADWQRLLNEVRFDRYDPAKPRPLGISDKGVALLGMHLSTHAVATRLDDIDVSLPEVRSTTLKVALTSAQSRAEARAQRMNAGLRRARSLDNASRDPRQLANAATAWKREHGSDHSHTLVLTQRLEVVAALEASMRGESGPVHAITGDTSPSQRRRILEEHRRLGGILIASEVGDTGYNFQYCSLLIEVCTPWEAERARQRLGRIRRPGSSHEQVEHVRIVPDSAAETQRAVRRGQKAALAHRLLEHVPDPSYVLLESV